ncbi:hypothetical protein U2044_15455, partial [Listeria monocytogenes]|uniref:hypothetical protein n=1 Tax=Listeria monocytogenes TaxID=1639 RepID=UPI002FDC50AD
TTVVLPDMQIGFKRDPITNQLIPLHDRRAMFVAVESIKRINPNRIVLLGDNLDFAELSKYPTSPDHTFTIQDALLEYSWWLGLIR